MEFVLSCDIVEMLRRDGRFVGANLAAAIDLRVARLVQRLGEVVSGQVDFSVMSAADLSTGIRRVCAGLNQHVVALDRTSIVWADAYAGTATAWTPEGLPRQVVHPGSTRTLEALPPRVPVVLVDIGAQSGNSLAAAADYCAAHGHPVAVIVLGLAGARTRRRLEGLCHRQVVLHTFGAMRWIELRDLLGFDTRSVIGETGVLLRCHHDPARLLGSLPLMSEERARALAAVMTARGELGRLLGQLPASSMVAT